MTTTSARAALGGVAFAALAASGAFAQEFCGGLSANGQWIGGEEASSDVTTAPSYLEQMALVLMQNQYVALFSVSAPTTVRVEAEGRGSGDPVLDLRDEAGAIVASDDDSGGNSASRAEVELQPGRYCLSMSSYDGSPMTGFVRVGRADTEALTDGIAATPPVDDAPPPVDDFAGGLCDMSRVTRFLGGGQPLDQMLAMGAISDTASVDEVPFWGFTLSQPTALSITAENVDADPVITLYDEFGGYLAENDDWDGLNSRIDMTYPLAAGSYCIAMNALADLSLPITVSVQPYDAAQAAIGTYDRAEAAPPLDGSYPVTSLGELSTRLRQDIQSTSTASWFSFDVPEAGLVLIEAAGGGQGDPTLVLFDDLGRQVAFNDDDGESLDSRITARVMPGTYLVAVRQLSEGTTALTRMSLERYVPAR